MGYIMTLKCKICLSEHKEFAEKLILQGLSTSEIAKELTSKGLILNQASVNRHKKRHMLEHADKIEELSIPIHNTKHDRNDYTHIDVDKVFDFDAKSFELSDIIQEHNKIRHLLNDIFRKQLAIVSDLQDKFIRGDAKYPHEEIKGLQTVQDLTTKFETFSKDLISELKKIYEQHLTDKEKLLAVQAETKKFQLEKDKGLWLETNKVYALHNETLKMIATWTESLADIIILECGMKEESFFIVREIIDRKREEIYQKIIDISE